MPCRSPGAPLLFPAVVHWKAGHYAAILKPLGRNYLVQDYTFPTRFSMTPDALDDESNGYFLVPPGPLPAGWQPVSESEASAVWGSGPVAAQDGNSTGCNDLTCG